MVSFQPSVCPFQADHADELGPDVEAGAVAAAAGKESALWVPGHVPLMHTDPIGMPYQRDS